MLGYKSRRAVRDAPVPGLKRKRRKPGLTPRLAHQGSGAKEEGDPMGTLRLEASWCKSPCNAGRVHIELDLMAALLFVKLAVVALAL